jgi:RNA polymerase sigma-70 factor (ECF subfamily)
MRSIARDRQEQDVLASTDQALQQREGIELSAMAVVTSQTRELYLASLLERVAQADAQALAALYDATSPYMYGLARCILQNQSLAEDVLIEVYTQVYQQASHYDPRRGTPSAWLLTLTRSRALDRRRSEALRQRWEASMDLAVNLPTSTSGPEEDSAAAELRQVIQTAMAALSPEQRQVVEIAYYEGCSHSEIAVKLGQPLGTVKTRLRLGLTALRRLLQPVLSEEPACPIHD